MKEETRGRAPAAAAQMRRSWVARRRARWPYPVLPMAAPDPPPGQRVGPPDFVGVGVQKAGTSWWFGLVADHPGVHRPPAVPKELHFFEPYWQQPFGDIDVAAYHRWFARPEGLLVGEWTPRYVADWWTPPLLARAAPEARLLVLLRDPVERYRSGVAFDRRQGAPDVALASQDAFQRGLYGAQLRRLDAHVAPERLLVLQYERCRTDPAGELARTYRFLGLDPGHRPPRLTEHVGPVAVKRPLPTDVEEALRAAYRDDLGILLDRYADLDPTLWPTTGES